MSTSECLTMGMCLAEFCIVQESSILVRMPRLWYSLLNYSFFSITYIKIHFNIKKIILRYNYSLQRRKLFKDWEELFLLSALYSAWISGQDKNWMVIHPGSEPRLWAEHTVFLHASVMCNDSQSPALLTLDIDTRMLTGSLMLMRFAP